MNFTLSKTNLKGKEEIKLTLSPEGNLEKEFFNALFANKEVKVESIPSSDEIVIKVKYQEEVK